MRENYATHGVQGYYEAVATQYRNPHFEGVVKGCLHALDILYPLLPAQTKRLRILDLACGSGEATIGAQQWRMLRSKRGLEPNDKLFPGRAPAVTYESLDDDFALDVTACDPYTQQAYRDRTQLEASALSFEDVANGLLETTHDLCICSFAAHLIDVSMLYATFYQLSLQCDYLLILSPHKKPQISSSYGWQLKEEAVVDMRVNVRLYQSLSREVST